MSRWFGNVILGVVDLAAAAERFRGLGADLPLDVADGPADLVAVTVDGDGRRCRVGQSPPRN